MVSPECSTNPGHSTLDAMLLVPERSRRSNLGGVRNPSARGGLKLGVLLAAKTRVAAEVGRDRYDALGAFV